MLTTPVLRTLALAALLVMTGCASAPRAPGSDDPFETYNRHMMRFNDDVDTAVLRPVATTYQAWVPGVVRTGVSNFFANLGDAWSLVNHALQLRPQGVLHSATRFSVNTLFGLGGLFDVAGEMGIERDRQDFGLTLARWGVPTGPYLVLPLLGPSTLRDTLALPVDWQGDVVSSVDPVRARNSLYALRVIDTRANLLRVSKMLESGAIDRYSFTRDIYLQLRRQERAADGRLDTPEQDGRLPPEPDE